MENARSGGNVLGIVMAGGRGERLFPLTQDRAKPAVPFDGKYRIIYSKSQSLINHLEAGLRLSDFLQDRFVKVVPFQMPMGDGWYRGTADAVHRVEIGGGCRSRRAIEDNVMAAGTNIGGNPARDRYAEFVPLVFGGVMSMP